jgi:4-amino-4-deoxy-L-arabinose transferase-like glycosyltransferase
VPTLYARTGAPASAGTSYEILLRRPNWHERASRVSGRDVAALASFALYGAIVWWPSRDAPYFWDAAPNVIDATRELVRAGGVPFHPYFAHPPLFHLLLALAWKIAGTSPAVSHAVALPWLPLAMGATYAIGTRIGGRLVGLAAAFVFGATPLAVCEAGQVYFELAATALATCGLAAWLGERRWAAAGLFTLAVLTKTTAILVPAALLPVVLAQRDLRFTWRPYVALAAPLVALLAWGAYHDSVTGWFLVAPVEAERLIAHDVATLVRHTKIITECFFLAQYRWLLLAGGVLAAAVTRVYRHEHLGRDALTCAFVASMSCAVAIPSNEFLTRYALVVLPAFAVASLALVRRALPRATSFGAFAALVVLLFGARWHPRGAASLEWQLQPPEDLTYLDTIAAFREVARLLEERHPGAEILGGFHESYVLGEPHQGYVHAPFAVTHCQYFTPRDDVPQIVVVHRWGLEQRICERLVASRPSALLARFEVNGKWIELRQLTRAP